mgnify:CR=1 FL=1
MMLFAEPSPVILRDPRLNAVASLKLRGLREVRLGGTGRDPRLNAVASLKLELQVLPVVRAAQVIHGLMPWPH